MSEIEANDETVIIFEKVEVQVELTPERVAEIFWAMGEDQQAKFFNALGRNRPSSLHVQSVSICDHEVLDGYGLKALESLADAVNGRR